MRKTPEEIQELKDNWRRDPCWEIEDTEGFEEHREELLAYSQEMKAHWKELAQKHHDELASKVCPLSFQWINPSREEGYTWQICLVEQCAWWDANNDCCTIRTLPLR